MKTDEIENLKDIVREVTSESYQSIAKVQSNGLGEIKTTLAIHTERLISIDNHLEELNGKTNSSIDNIQDLQKSRTEIHSSFYGAKWIGAGSISIIIILIGVISSLAVYTYNNDRDNNNQQYQQLYDLLKNKK